MKLISVPEVLIQQHGQGVMVARITALLDPEKITSIRAVSLPGELKGADGNSIPKAGTEVRLGADRILVDLCDVDFLGLLPGEVVFDVNEKIANFEALEGTKLVVNVDGEVVEKGSSKDDRADDGEVKTIKFPGKG